MLKTGKKILCTLLVVVMCLTAAPLEGFVGIEWPELPEISFGEFELPKIDFSSWFGGKASALDATGQCGDNLYWNYNSETKELVISGTGTMYDLAFSKRDIKSVVIEDGVTSIDRQAFYCCESLVSVTIPDSVTDIGVHAFSGCTNLTSVTIPDNVTSIDKYAFYNCTTLTSIVIPDSVTKIGDCAFAWCASLTSVTMSNSVTSIARDTFAGCESLVSITIPNGVTSIDSGAFASCINLTNITIPEIVTSIGDYAFSDCASLTNITIPDSVTSIGNYIFSNCASLISMTIPEGVTSIGNYAFSDCASLISMTIPEGVTSIGNYAFSDCASLTNITIPNSVTSIGYSAFADCTSLTSITIPDGVTSIEYYTFYNCSSLASITIPGSVLSIGQYAFQYCTSLTSLNITSIESWCNIKFASSSSDPLPNAKNLYINGKLIEDLTIPCGVTYISDYLFSGYTNIKNIIIPDSVITIGDSAFSGCTNVENVIIPNSVTSIGDYSFSGCESLESIIIPGSITNISRTAFQYCTSLTNLTISDGVTSIGDAAFYNCLSLTSITIPDSVTSIGDAAFYNCLSLTSITIPDSVTSIGDSAFSRCTSLISIVIPDSVTSIGDAAFFSCERLLSITIPSGITSIGEKAFYGCTSLTSITIPKGVTSIGNAAFFSCERLLSITIPSGITSIGEKAFYGCTSLTSITIPKGVTSIDDYTFYNCKSLTNTTIPNSVTSIGANAFYGCTSFTSITIPEGVTSVGNSAFCNCTSLTSIIIPEGVTSIDDYTFYNCKSLTNTTIPNSVTSIGANAFYGCTSFTSITIPEGVTSVGNSAFCNCTSLASITIPGSVESIGANAFYGCISLKNVTIPDGVISIGERSFYICNSLVSITIPDSVTSIGEDAFLYCGSLTSIIVDENNNQYSSDSEGVLFNKEQTILIKCPARIPGATYSIPSSVTTIVDNAFYGCTNLENIAVPDSLTSIGANAFYGCTSFTSITIPNGVTSIEYGTFYSCYALKNIVVSDSVTSVGDGAFSSCNELKSVCYLGTQEQWNEMQIGSDNNSFIDKMHIASKAISESVVPTCIKTGLKEGVHCSTCNSVIVMQQEIPALGHDYSAEWTIDVKATCTTDGSKSQHCSRCDDKTDVTVIPAYGHSYRNYVEIKAPTCTELGIAEKVCSVCNDIQQEDIPALGHSYSSYVEIKASTCTELGIAEKVCSICNDIQQEDIPALGHSYSNFVEIIAPTCTKLGIAEKVCSVCNDIQLEDIPALGHSYSEWIEIQTPTCTETGMEEQICSRCGDVQQQVIPALGHDYSEEWTIDIEATCIKDGSKSHQCSRCDEKADVTVVPALGHSYSEWTEIKAPTCTKTGIEEQICSRCKDVQRQVVPALGHDYSKEWTIDIEATCTAEGSKSHHCSRCDDKADVTVVPALGHSYSEWTEIKAPTCTKTGMEEQICLRCGDVQRQVIPALGHDYSEEWTVDIEATCITDGSKSHHCSRCDDKADITVVPALGHNYSDWTEIKAPTCTKTGMEEQICLRCGDVQRQVIPALGHDYSEEWTVDIEATCTTDGSKSHHCSRCDDKADITVIPALGHNYSEWIEIKAPTCIKTGIEEQICSRCRDIQQQEIPALGHDYSGEWTVDVEVTCTTDGSKSHHCSRCDDKADITIIEAFGHNYKSVVTMSTCTNNGYTTYTCIVCNNKYKDNIVNAKGHNYEDIKTEPTCVTDGYTVHICSVCSYSYTDSFVKKKGHINGEWIVVTTPTCTVDGIRQSVCETCGINSTQIVEALGHNYGEWITEKEATILAEGLQVRFCERCNNKESKITEKICVDIENNKEYGLVNFTVVNAQTLESIEGANVFVSTEKDGEGTFVTDDNGKVSIIMPIGKQTISVYAKDCLTRNISINVKPGENDVSKIGLSNLNTYDVEIDHRLMTYEEILEAGIDISDPANNHVYRYELKLEFEPEVDIPSIIAYFNEVGDWLGGYADTFSFNGTISPGTPGGSGEHRNTLHYHVGDVYDCYHSWCKVVDVEVGETKSLSYRPWRQDYKDYIFDGWYKNSNYTEKISSVYIDGSTTVYGRWIYIGDEPENENKQTKGIEIPIYKGEKIEEIITVYPVSEYFYLIIRGEVKWLKEMFDVQMLIINNSQTDVLENLTATLELPNGLSLASMVEEQQTIEQYIERIDEGESQLIHWYVRGDKAGSYDIEARLKGTVMPFEEPIDDCFKARNKLQVWAGKALNLHFEFPEAAYYGEDYPITITLTNISDITLYNISHKIQVEEGMEIYYSDGTSKTKIESSKWVASTAVKEFHPGDKIIIEASANIFFKSEMMENYLKKYIDKVDGVELLLNSFKATKNGVEACGNLTKYIIKAGKALDFKDSTLSSISADKRKATSNLYEAIASLYGKYAKKENKTLDSTSKLTSTGVAEMLDYLSSDNVLEYLEGKDIKDIYEITSKISALANSLEATTEDIRNFDIFDSIRTMISAIPIRYMLTNIIMIEDKDNTTSIPWSYSTTEAEVQYFGVSNMSSYLSDIIVAIAAELWEGNVTNQSNLLNLIEGFDDPFKYDEVKRRIIAVEKEIEYFQTKDATGKISFKAYYVPNQKNRLKNFVGNDGYTLECDNESAVFEDGVLTFTGDGIISLTPTNTNGGTLYIEDSEGNTYTYDITVVEQHECTASRDQRVIINPTAEYDGFAVKCCETCEDVMEIITLSTNDCEAHTFGECTAESEATCTIDGVANRVCSTCGYKEYDFIDAMGHTEKIVNKVDATCIEPGYTGDVVCEVCEEIIMVGESIDATNHNYEAEVTDPTCTQYGYTIYTCLGCGDSYKTDETEKMSHTEEILTAKVATCKETGLTEGKKCSVCGEILLPQLEIAKLKHSYTSKITAPTCTANGYTIYTCILCGDSYSADEKTSIGHNYIGGVCTFCGDNKTQDCSCKCHKTGFITKLIWKFANFFNKLLKRNQVCECGAVHYGTIDNKVEHTHSYIREETLSPTCVTDGLSTYLCGCGKSYTEVIPASHAMVIDEEKTVAPTCTVDGISATVCSVCGYSETAVLTSKGHIMNNGVCSVCGYSKIAECDCKCHKTSIVSKLVWKISVLLNKFLRKNQVCPCGVYHY